MELFGMKLVCCVAGGEVSFVSLLQFYILSFIFLVMVILLNYHWDDFVIYFIFHFIVFLNLLFHLSFEKWSWFSD